MGFNPWNAFRTEFDEVKLLRIADTMVAQGLVRSGYRFLNIDDGWWLKRDARGILQIRTSMFPSARVSDTETSFRPFVDMLHAKGLKAGIYTDIGRNACSQHWDPASSHLPQGSLAERQVGLFEHQVQDANLFFNTWGFDSVKVDACGLADFGPGQANVRDGEYSALGPWIFRGHPERSEIDKVIALYAGFATALRSQTSPPPVLEVCAWGEAGVNDWAYRYANLWRTSGDIEPTWASMLANFDAAAPRALFAGPGHWNDPDMLEVGNGAFDRDHLVEARAHLSLWSILAAPLILSYDLTTSSPELLDSVRNPEMIAIDQDAAGNQGVIVSKTDETEIVYRALDRTGSRAVALINRGLAPVSLQVTLAQVHLRPSAATHIRNIWHKQDTLIQSGSLTVHLEAHETALLRVEGRPLEEKVSYLADLPASIQVVDTGSRPNTTSPDKPYVPAQFGYAPSGEPIVVNGRHETDSLGVASHSRLRITLSKPYRRFLVQAEDSHTESAGSKAFSIYGDGKLLPQQNSGHAGVITVPLAGVHSLDLVAPEARPDTPATFVWRRPRLVE